MSASLFEQFRKSLTIPNASDISVSYAEITKRLNKDFWDSESDSAHSLQVGSYGRHTAIKGVSDLDMAFELPLDVFERLSNIQSNGPSQLLQEVRNSILNRYSTSEVKGDGQVVVVSLGKLRFEVLPVFFQSDGSYRFGDSNNGGSWDNYCWPKEEIQAVNSLNGECNRNLKRVAKMLRAWKDTHGAPISGMLIDTLSFNFLKSNKNYNDKSYGSYPNLVRDILAYLANQPDQDYWLAPGSASRVYSVGKFQSKAKKAAKKAQDALDAESDKDKHREWKDIFGRLYPALQSTSTAKMIESYGAQPSTEEFIEDKFPVDIHYNIEIGYDVHYSGNRELSSIRFMEATFPWLKLGRNINFYVIDCNVPEPYSLLWKVRNVGQLAESNNRIRGQLESDKGHREKSESTSFGGPHYVECYVIKDEICVARDKVDVLISSV